MTKQDTGKKEQIPGLEQWILIEESLKKYGADEEKIKSTLNDFVTALYYMQESNAAAACYFRGVKDLFSEYSKDKDGSDGDGISLYSLLILEFMSVCAGRRFLADVQGFVLEHAGFLKVILPDLPSSLTLPSADRLVQISRFMSDNEIKNLVCGTSAALKRLYEKVGAPALRVDKSTLRSCFFESYDLYDAFNNLNMIQVDLAELMKRFGKYIGKRTGLATAMDNGSDCGPDFLSFSDRMVDYVDGILVKLGREELSEEQAFRFVLFVLMNIRVRNRAVICSNTDEGLKIQKALTKGALFKDNAFAELDKGEDYDPSVFFSIPDPAFAFTGTPVDEFNNYVMPIGEDPSLALAAQEKKLKSMMLQHAADTEGEGVHLFFCVPQEESSVYEAEHWVLLPVKADNFAKKIYKGRTPYQGWHSILIRYREDVSAEALEKAYTVTKSNISRLRRKLADKEDVILSVSVNEGSYSSSFNISDLTCGRIRGSDGRCDGFIRLEIFEEEIIGEQVSLPERTYREKDSEVFLTTFECDESSVNELLYLFNPGGGLIAGIKEKIQGSEFAARKISGFAEDFRDFAYLKNTVQSLLRCLHTKQISSQSLIAVRYVRDLIEHDVYYLTDGFVLFSMIFEYMMRNRKRRKKGEEEELSDDFDCIDPDESEESDASEREPIQEKERVRQ